MKKIPTLFARQFEGRKIVGVADEITPGCEDAFKHGIATVKYDGTCCAVIDGVFYKRYDAKKGKNPPAGSIPCCDPDPVTGHWPHLVKVDENDKSNKYFMEAYNYTLELYESSLLPDGTYECVGPKIQGNPYRKDSHVLIPHGHKWIGELVRDFDSIKEYLRTHNIEGIVFWYNNEPVCKIKRSDFGFKWPINEKEN